MNNAQHRKWTITILCVGYAALGAFEVAVVLAGPIVDVLGPAITFLLMLALFFSDDLRLLQKLQRSRKV